MPGSNCKRKRCSMQHACTRGFNTAPALRGSAAGFHVLRTARRAMRRGRRERGLDDAVSVGKSCENRSKNRPEQPGDAPERPWRTRKSTKSAQGGQRGSQEWPKSAHREAQERPKITQVTPRAAKRRPRAPQERPKGAPKRPKSTQERRKWVPEGCGSPSKSKSVICWKSCSRVGASAI